MTDGPRLTPPGGRKVPPDPNRPKLSPELEERLAPLHQKSAELLDAFEDLERRADELAADIEEGIVTLPVTDTETALHQLGQAVRDAKDPEG